MPETAPLFSVIIPAYNREKFVGAALCSVAGQTFSDWECIVVDDGSTDGTRVSVQMIVGILQGLAQKEKTKEPSIRLIRTKNGGPGAARNAGAAEAKGKYLAFLDSDDMWRPWTLETYRDVLEKAGWPTLLMACVQTFTNDGELPVWPQTLRFQAYPDALTAGAAGHTPGAGMSVVLAEAFRATGGYWIDRINAEDHDLTLRLGDAPGFVVVEAPVTLGYRRHGVQETEVSERTVAGMERLIAKEKAGGYSGGPTRARERRAILCAHVRPVCVTCLKAGQWRLAWRLYRATLGWQLAAGRWKFFVGFPVLATVVFLERMGRFFKKDGNGISVLPLKPMSRPVILFKDSGELGNRLVSYAYLLAFGAEHHIRVANLCFWRYAHFFGPPAPLLECAWVEGQVTVQKRVVKGKFEMLLAKMVFSRGFHHIRRRLMFDGGLICSWPALMRRSMSSVIVCCNSWLAPIVKCFGFSVRSETKWQHRCELLAPHALLEASLMDQRMIIKHADLIRSRFQLTQQLQDDLKKFFSPLRRRYQRIVGVHIRRGDYSSYHGGKWFFDDATYRNLMLRIGEMFPGERVGFIIATNGPFSEKDFAGLDVHLALGHLALDMYALAGCDLIVGPPSTFSGWASFIGRTPIYFIKDKEAVPSTSELHEIWTPCFY